MGLLSLTVVPINSERKQEIEHKAGQFRPAFFMCENSYSHKCLYLLDLNGIAKKAQMSIILLSLVNRIQGAKAAAVFFRRRFNGSNDTGTKRD
jgi:hypothetical protein